jgi:hypothetical protein
MLPSAIGDKLSRGPRPIRSSSTFDNPDSQDELENLRREASAYTCETNSQENLSFSHNI